MSLYRQLDPTSPVDTDLISAGDDNLREIKQALWDQWPNFTAVACTPTVQEINTLAGIDTGQSIQQQIDANNAFVGWGGWRHNEQGVVSNQGTMSTIYKDLISTVTAALAGNSGVNVSGITGGITPVVTPATRVVLHAMLSISTDTSGVLQLGFRNSGTPLDLDLPGMRVDRTFNAGERRLISLTSPMVPAAGSWHVCMRALGGDVQGVGIINGGFWMEYA